MTPMPLPLFAHLLISAAALAFAVATALAVARGTVPPTQAHAAAAAVGVAAWALLYVASRLWFPDAAETPMAVVCFLAQATIVTAQTVAAAARRRSRSEKQG